MVADQAVGVIGVAVGMGAGFGFADEHGGIIGAALEVVKVKHEYNGTTNVLEKGERSIFNGLRNTGWRKMPVLGQQGLNFG